ncbi:MAG: PAS domain S-box protein [Gammaproteobacteria bacterium]|jgi:PAS domain S-box-containing protein|nr:PAS domain S-box protein [Gammaproteobacteria bacterium]
MQANSQPERQDNITSQFWSQFKLTVYIFIPILILWLLVLSMHYEYRSSKDIKIKQQEQTRLVVDHKQALDNIMISAIKDLKFLTSHIETTLQKGHFAPHLKTQLARELIVFMRVRGGYDQARLIDIEGNEIIRINHNNGQPTRAVERDLRNKAQRYYFTATKQLAPGAVYTSPLDLNVEDNKVEYPLKPTIRIGTPIHDSKGELIGVFILNYDALPITQRIHQANKVFNSQSMLLNEAGYWLASSNPENEWNFMFSRQYKFVDAYQNTWHTIKSQQQGQFQNSHGLFTFDTIRPNYPSKDKTLQAKSYVWKVVTLITPTELLASREQFSKHYGAFYLALLMLSLIGSVIIANITLKRRSMQAQRDYERRFRHSLETIQLGAASIDQKGNIIFCNDYLLLVSGWRKEQLLHRPWLTTFSPDEKRQQDEKRLNSILNGSKKYVQFGGHILTKEGKLTLFSWTLTPLISGEKNIIGATMIGTNITEQRQAEEQIRLLGQAVEQSPSTVMITNSKAEITYVNPKFEQRTGYALEEIKGKNPRFLKSGEMDKKAYQAMWDSILNDGAWRGELHNRKKDGTLHWEDAQIVPIYNNKGHLTHYLSVKEDITERKALEQEVALRNKEMARNRELAAMGRMAGMVAHDLRNPMSSIKMTLQMLTKQEGKTITSSITELTRISLEQIGYMEALLTDLLIYSRPDQLNLKTMQSEQLLQSACHSLQSLISKKGVKIHINLSPEQIAFEGDQDKLCRVFVNLFSNAIQAHDDQKKHWKSTNRPQIWVDGFLQTDATGEHITFDINDNGPGIDLSKLDQLFEPFYTERAKGTGLGLSIVKRIVEQHHGAIDVSLNQMHGTCIRLCFPRVQPDQIEADNQPLVSTGRTLKTATMLAHKEGVKRHV